jgi:hypothetical protein
MTAHQLAALIEAFASDVATFARTGQYGTAARDWLWSHD